MRRLIQRKAMSILTMNSRMSILKEKMFEILVTVLPINVLSMRAV